MNSLTRSSLLSRTTTARSQLRRSLPSIYAGVSSASACDASTCCSPVVDQQRFLQTTTTTNINLMSTSSSSLASARRMSANKSSLFSTYRSFHGTPRQLEDAAAAAAAPEEEEADSSNDEPHPTEIEYEFTPPPPLSEESIGKVNGLFEKILHLDMVEVHLLTMIVNEQLGIKWNQVQAPGAGPIGGGAAAGAAPAEEAVEEKLLKDLKLVGFDAKAKIKVIKEVRAIAGLGLKEAKEMVEGAPKIIQKELKPEKAEELKAQLEAVGAQIEIC